MEITQLIERCRHGDESALGQLYKAYARKMRGVCRRYISDEDAVNDVLHDAFVIIFTSFDKLRDDSKAESWMMSITRNVASKCKNQLAALPTISLDESNEPEFQVEETDDKNIRGVPLEEVIRLIDRLPDGYGKVFRLSVFEGMTHNEIAAMLDIEPHSSSSQLARAKKMLRKLMRQYWAAVLLLLLIPATFFLLWREEDAVPEVKPAKAKQQETPKKPQAETPSETPSKQLEKATTEPLDHKQYAAQGMKEPQEPVIVCQPVPVYPTNTVTADTLLLQPVIAQTSDSIETDTLTHLTAQETITDSINKKEQADTVRTIRNIDTPHYNMAGLSPNKPAVGVTPPKEWSVNLAYAGGFDNQNLYGPYAFTETPITGTTSSEEPPSLLLFSNWSDYASYLSELPDDGGSHTRSIIMNIALNNAGNPENDKIVRKRHHSMPVAWTLTLKYRLDKRFGIESGLSYSRLTSDFEMGADGNAIQEHQTIHYLGIPVKGSYVLHGGKTWSIYGSLGVTTEIPIHSPLTTSYYLHGRLKASDKSTIRAPWQWSVSTGLGLQYNFTPNIGVFAEPSLQYYIPTGRGVETYRTEHPFSFSLPLGIRFTW